MPTTQVRERPILFSAPMVLALLDGRKTQTRRILNPQPTQKLRGYGTMPGSWAFPHRNRFVFTVTNKPEGPDGWAAENCPYGVPGDRMWVRESARIVAKGPNCEHHYIDYRAGGLKDCADIDTVAACAGGFYAPGEAEDPEAPDEKGRWVWPWKTRSSIPRWASRITLEITDVRVQRVQDISEEDARAEGCEPALPVADKRWVCGYSRLWDSINGPSSWASNPWVWAITFEVVK